jgi:hypothetical protein
MWGYNGLPPTCFWLPIFFGAPKISPGSIRQKSNVASSQRGATMFYFILFLINFLINFIGFYSQLSATSSRNATLKIYLAAALSSAVNPLSATNSQSISQGSFRASISGTALSGRKPIIGRFSVPSESFQRQNVQRLAGLSCKRELYAWFCPSR